MCIQNMHISSKQHVNSYQASSILRTNDNNVYKTVLQKRIVQNQKESPRYSKKIVSIIYYYQLAGEGLLSVPDGVHLSMLGQRWEQERNTAMFCEAHLP